MDGRLGAEACGDGAGGERRLATAAQPRRDERGRSGSEAAGALRDSGVLAPDRSALNDRVPASTPAAVSAGARPARGRPSDGGDYR